MKYLFLIFFVFLGCALSGIAKNESEYIDHLQPCSLSFGLNATYLRWLDLLLMKRSGSDALKGVLISVLQMESFYGERYLAVIQKDDNPEKFEFYYAHAEKQIFCELRKHKRSYYPDDENYFPVPKIDVIKKTFDCPKDLAQALSDIWIKMLLRTKYFQSKPLMLLDGSRYIFYAFDKQYNHLYAKTELVATTGSLELLEQIVKTLFKFCSAVDNQHHEEDLKRLHELVKTIKEEIGKKDGDKKCLGSLDPALEMKIKKTSESDNK